MEFAGAGGGLLAVLFGAGPGLAVAVAGGVGIASEFAVTGRSAAVELGRDSAGRGSLLVQGMDLTGLVLLQVTGGSVPR